MEKHTAISEENGARIFSLARPLVLASASPRRRAFLRDIGVACDSVAPPEQAEPLPLPGEAPDAFALRAARAKTQAVAALFHAAEQGGVPAVLGADTVVALDGRILGKPSDYEEAFAFVKMLSGKTHHVYTACCLCLGEGEQDTFIAGADVRMGAWPDHVLRAYAATGEGLDKAGGYAVQGIGSFLVEHVAGSWSAVVGLPMAETVAALLARGILAAG